MPQAQDVSYTPGPAETTTHKAQQDPGLALQEQFSLFATVLAWMVDKHFTGHAQLAEWTPSFPVALGKVSCMHISWLHAHLGAERQS